MTTRHADPELESQLPSEIGGTVLTVYSLGPNDFVSVEGEHPFTAFLGRLGKAPTDVSLAVAFDRAGNLPGSVSALKVVGAGSEELLAALIANEGSVPTFGQVVLGGKTVTKVAYEGGTTHYLFVRGDIAFTVFGDDATAGQFLEALG